MRHSLAPHRSWILFTIAALMLIGFSAYLSQSITKQFTLNQDAINNEKSRLVRQITLWQDNAEAARSLRERLADNEIDALLKPMDVQRTEKMIEALAALSHLTHLKLSLDNRQVWNGGTSFTGIEGIDQYRLSLDADAPRDNNCFVFIKALSEINGRIEIGTLNISRLPQSTLGPLNIHLSLRGFWYGNVQKAPAQ